MAVVRTSGNGSGGGARTAEEAVLELFPSAVVLSTCGTLGDEVEVRLLTLSGCTVVLELDADRRVTHRRTLAWHGPAPAHTRMSVPLRTARASGRTADRILRPHRRPWFGAPHAA